MKKLINGPDEFLRDGLDGMALAHADLLVLDEQRRYLRRRQTTPG